MKLCDNKYQGSIQTYPGGVRQQKNITRCRIDGTPCRFWNNLAKFCPSNPAQIQKREAS